MAADLLQVAISEKSSDDWQCRFTLKDLYKKFEKLVNSDALNFQLAAWDEKMQERYNPPVEKEY